MTNEIEKLTDSLIEKFKNMGLGKVICSMDKEYAIGKLIESFDKTFHSMLSTANDVEEKAFINKMWDMADYKEMAEKIYTCFTKNKDC